jgi:hypothetical protein
MSALRPVHTVHNSRLLLKVGQAAEIWQNIIFHAEYFSSNSYASILTIRQVLDFGRPCVSSGKFANSVDEI